MSEQYLGEIKLVSFNFPPKGWAFCNGQVMAISQNQALFALLGTYYGGDGIRTFQLPNLQAAMPIHQGNGYSLGQMGGESAHTLVTTEIPSHNHNAQGVSTNATSAAATGNTWPVCTQNAYGTAANTTMLPGTVSLAGGSQPHPNMPPYLVLSFIIALQGIFPSQN